MRLVFVGSTKRGYLTLQALVSAGVPLAGIISLAQDEHETERFEDSIRRFAESHGIPLKASRTLKDPSFISWVRDELKADLAFLAGARVLMPETLMAAFPQGCWAAHDSLLPRYRGFAPLNWAVINGEVETGVTLFRLTAETDDGEVLLQQRLPIGPTETAPQLYDRVCEATTQLMVEGYGRLARGSVELTSQDETKATYTCSRNPNDGLIEWTAPTGTIYNLIRGLTFPYPGAFTYHRGQRLTVVSAEIPAVIPHYVGRIPGRVVKIAAGKGVDVLTGDGLLRLTRVSLDGRSVVEAAGAIKSVRTRLGIDPVPLIETFARQELPPAP